MQVDSSLWRLVADVKLVCHSSNMGTQPVMKGAIADAVARNVSAVRQRRQLTQQGLAAKLASLGRPMQGSAVAKIETGRRAVTVDDLVALAAALNVTPARLLLPDASEHEPVLVTPRSAVPAYAAWQWMTGSHSLLAEGANLNDPEVRHQELDFAGERPTWLRAVEAQPLFMAVKHLEWRVRRVLRYAPSEGGTPPSRPPVGLRLELEASRQAVEAVQHQLDQLDEEATRGER